MTIGAIFVGAVGSGVWARLLEPLLSFAAALSVKAIAAVSGGYLDFLYSKVARDPVASAATMPTLFLLVSVVIASCLAAFYVYGTRNEDDAQHHSDEDDDQAPRYVRYVLVAGCVLLAIGYSEALFRTIYTIQVARYVDRSIEILAPEIGEQERLRLRASFRSVESARDYYRLEAQLENLAQKHNAHLPDPPPR